MDILWTLSEQVSWCSTRWRKPARTLRNPAPWTRFANCLSPVGKPASPSSTRGQIIGRMVRTLKCVTVTPTPDFKLGIQAILRQHAPRRDRAHFRCRCCLNPRRVPRTTIFPSTGGVPSTVLVWSCRFGHAVSTRCFLWAAPLMLGLQQQPMPAVTWTSIWCWLQTPVPATKSNATTSCAASSHGCATCLPRQKSWALWESETLPAVWISVTDADLQVDYLRRLVCGGLLTRNFFGSFFPFVGST